MAAQFAPWVEPIAEKLAESRKEIADVARLVRAEAWSDDSDYPGWTYKDHLSHLPYSYEGLVSVVATIADGDAPDFSRFDNIDSMNEANRQQHVNSDVEQLLAGLAQQGGELEAALARLKPEHAGLDLGQMTFGQALSGFTMHDQAHLAEIKKALSQ